MKHTNRRSLGERILPSLMILLALPIVSYAQNVHVTTEQPFQFTRRSKGWQNSSSLGTSYILFGSSKIPEDKMLVVEQFSAEVAVNPGERVTVTVNCHGVKSVFPALHHPVLTSQGIFGGVRGGLEFLSVSLPLRCYTLTGDFGLTVTLRRNSQAPVPNITAAESEIAVSGFLQDLPN